MSQRQLFLAAYDVSEPSRLHQAHDLLRDYSTGGQKSVFECYLGQTEQRQLINGMDALMEHSEDRFFLLRLETPVITLGGGHIIPGQEHGGGATGNRKGSKVLFEVCPAELLLLQGIVDGRFVQPLHG